MKFAVFFFLCLVALAAAAPQLLAYPGYLAPGLSPFVPRTLVAGPTVVNGVGPLGLTRYVTAGYVGPTLY